jgi:hypothetical protein
MSSRAALGSSVLGRALPAHGSTRVTEAEINEIVSRLNRAVGEAQ